MENLPRNLGKELNIRTLPKPSKRTQRWTLLFVGNHGKVIPVTRFVELVIVSALALIAAVTAAAVLYIMYKGKVIENNALTDALADSRQKVAVLQDEKDKLMVRLVLTESSKKETLAINFDKTPEKSPEITPRSDTMEKAVDSDIDALRAKAQPEKSLASVPATISTQTTNSDQVDVEDFSVFREPDSNTLRVEFQIKKTVPELESVSGYAFVVLKNTETADGQGLVFPPVDLISGKPSLIKKGQFFSIARFKSMKFEKNDLTDVERFNSAAVLVYDTKETLLMEKNFPISWK